ncbi:MAG: restriction endonuclease subunit S [Hyphomonas oceanitis]|uniref:restriction endonuclease subunit S n=1 Tax=Hyphomonas oceanitis TaxID=81033 RepID=UPI003002C369
MTLHDGLVERDSLERKTDTNLAPEDHLRVEAGDIAYNMMRMWQGASGLARYPALVSPAYVVLKPTPRIDPLFAAYLFKSSRMIYLLWAYSYGLTSDRLRLYFDDFSLIPVDLPPIEEQRRIAEILATWDRAIDTTEKLIVASEAQKKALMQQLLTGEKRLPGFEGKWLAIKLSAAVQVDPETLSEATSPDFGFRYISLSEVADGEVANKLSQMRFGNAPSRARKIVRQGDIIMSTVRPNLQGFAKIRRSDADLVASTGFAVLRATPKADIDFILHWLFSESVSRQLHGLVAGSNYPAVSTKEVKALELYCPPLDEQRAVALRLNIADRNATILRQKLQTLRTEKAALMQQLLTGKRRVNIKEMAA